MAHCPPNPDDTFPIHMAAFLTGYNTPPPQPFSNSDDSETTELGEELIAKYLLKWLTTLQNNFQVNIRH